MKRIAICDDSEIERQIFSEMLKEYWRMLHRQVAVSYTHLTLPTT